MAMILSPSKMNHARGSPSGRMERWDVGNGSCYDDHEDNSLSVDSSILNNAVSPFDDIGYLAYGGTGGSFKIPNTAADPKVERSGSIAASNSSNGGGGPSLDAFLGSSRHAPASRLAAVQEQNQQEFPQEQEQQPQALEDNINQQQELGDEVSLGMSAINLPPKHHKGGSRNFFDISKQSLGILPSRSKTFDSSKQSIGLSSSCGQNSSKNKSKASFESSTSKHNSMLSKLSGASGDSTSKHNSMLSKISGASGDSTRSSDKGVGRKFSSLWKGDKISKEQQELIGSLQSQNSELSSENQRLQAKVAELSMALSQQASALEWFSVEELATTTTDLCRARTSLLLATQEIGRLEAKLELSEKLVEAKERSIGNLEQVRDTQEKRIAALEVTCLQNGMDFPDEEEPVKLNIDVVVKSGSSTHEGSFASLSCASFGGDDNDLNISERDVDKPSPSLSKKSGHSQKAECKATKGPMGLGDYLGSSHVVPKVGSLGEETGTFVDSCLAVRDGTTKHVTAVTALAPPPPPEQINIHTEPPPSQRKRIPRPSRTRQSRSSSPGTRRKVKETPATGDIATDPSQPWMDASDRTAPPKLSGPRPLRSKSPGLRRKLKENSLDLSERSSGPRRMMKDSLDYAGSSHSTGRRRNRRACEADRQAVSSALEMALGKALDDTSPPSPPSYLPKKKGTPNQLLRKHTGGKLGDSNHGKLTNSNHGTLKDSNHGKPQVKKSSGKDVSLKKLGQDPTSSTAVHQPTTFLKNKMPPCA